MRDVDTLQFFTQEMVRPFQRQPEARGEFELPAGTIVVSADNHFSVAENIWVDRFPAHLKDKAPRVWQSPEGAYNVGFDGTAGMPPLFQSTIGEFDRMAGSASVEERVYDLDAEGVVKEIVFPNSVLALLFCPDLVVREYIFRIYNEYMAEQQQKLPGRFYPVGLINWWDPSRTQASLEELKSLGLKAFMLPQNAGMDADGRKIDYQAAYMEPMWRAIEESGLPVAFHIGEALASSERGEPGVSILQNFSPFRKTFGELVFGGILDRHPGLQVVFAEAGINWVASALQDMAFIYSSHRNLGTWQLREDVEYYWRNHMYATFMFDKIGLALLDIIGPDRVMWSSDYPHNESAFGYGWSSMKNVVDATTPDNARKILGGTALKLWNLQD